MYLFIPYHIFCYEKDFTEYNDIEHYLEELKKIYENILEKLEAARRLGRVNEYIKHILIDMTTRVLKFISTNHQQVQKGLSDIMGGKVLDYPAKTLYNQAKAEGELSKLLKQIYIKLEKGKSVEQIACR